MGYPMLKMLLQNNINATGHDIKASKILRFWREIHTIKVRFFFKK